MLAAFLRRTDDDFHHRVTAGQQAFRLGMKASAAWVHLRRAGGKVHVIEVGMEQLVIDCGQVLAGNLRHGAKPSALAFDGQICVKDHAVAVRMVLSRGVFEIPEVQLDEFHRQQTQECRRQSHPDQPGHEPTPFFLGIGDRCRPGEDGDQQEDQNNGPNREGHLARSRPMYPGSRSAPHPKIAWAWRESCRTRDHTHSRGRSNRDSLWPG